MLSVTGRLENVAKAFALVATKMAQDQIHLEGTANPSPEFLAIRPVLIRFLVPSARVGFIIGRSGSKIREIQEKSGARVSANNDAVFAQTTDRIVIVEGVIDAVHLATFHIGTVLTKDQAISNGGTAGYNTLPRSHTARPNRMNANQHHQHNHQQQYFIPFPTPLTSPYVSPYVFGSCSTELSLKSLKLLTVFNHSKPVPPVHITIQIVVVILHSRPLD